MTASWRAAGMLLGAVLVLAAACGDPSSTDTTTPTSGASAPDFSLQLGEGGTFILSEEARPVFIVFWAEW